MYGPDFYGSGSEGQLSPGQADAEFPRVEQSREGEQPPVRPRLPRIVRERVPAKALVLAVKRLDAKFEYAPYKAHLIYFVEIPEKDADGNPDPFAGLWTYRPKHGAIGDREDSLRESIARAMRSSFSYSWERRRVVPQLLPGLGEEVFRPLAEYSAVVGIDFSPHVKRLGEALARYGEAISSISRPTPAVASEPKP